MTVYRSHCGRDFGTVALLELHNGACGMCRVTISKLAQLRNADGGTCGAKSGTLTNPHDAGTCVMPRDHRGDHIGQGLAWASGTSLKLIGLDPGLASFGVAIAELPDLGSGKPRFLSVQAWHTKPSAELKRLRKMDDTAERCTGIAEQLHDMVQAHKPVALCVEATALPWRPGRGIQTSVISALGRVRGLIDMLAVVHQLPVLEESPQRVKKAATGSIGATKEGVRLALEEQYPELRELWPERKGDLEHVADACGAIHACRGADVVLAARAAAARAA